MTKKQWLKRIREQRYNHFLNGFYKCHLRTVVQYYHLDCADYNQIRCLRKSIRENNLSFKQIWKALIYG